MSHFQYTHLLCCPILIHPPKCRPMPTGNARPFFCHYTDAPHMSNTSIFDGPSSMTTDQTPAQSQYPISHLCPPPRLHISCLMAVQTPFYVHPSIPPPSALLLQAKLRQMSNSVHNGFSIIEWISTIFGSQATHVCFPFCKVSAPSTLCPHTPTKLQRISPIQSPIPENPCLCAFCAALFCAVI
jgi:hypothetical protein